MAGILQQLSGNPLATPIGQKIEQATDPNLTAEDWFLNMEICDMINDTDEGPRDAVRAIKKRFQQSAGKNHSVVMYTLTVLEACVKNCGKRFHLLVTNKDFVQDLVKLIGPKNDPPPAVQEKVLSLIQSWTDAFRNQSELQGVVQVYNELKSKGIEFPMTDLETMAPIHTPQRSVPLQQQQQLQLQQQQQPLAQQQPQATTQPPVSIPPQAQQPLNLTQGNHPASPANTLPKPQTPRHILVGPVNLNADQLAKLRSELDVVQGNMKVFNEMLNELNPGKENKDDWDLLRDLNSTCQNMQKRIVELIEKVANEEVTNELLRVNDELNNLFVRYERFVKKRTQTGTPRKDKSEEQSLIDLNDDNTPVCGAAAITGMMKDLNVRKTATKEPAAGAVARPVGDADFDMFAQARSMSFDKSQSTYKENVNTDPSLLAKQDLPLSDSKEDIDEMERWLKDQPNAQEAASLSNSEFERFLVERQKSAERLPSTQQKMKPEKDPFDL